MSRLFAKIRLRLRSVFQQKTELTRNSTRNCNTTWTDRLTRRKPWLDSGRGAFRCARRAGGNRAKQRGMQGHARCELDRESDARSAIWSSHVAQKSRVQCSCRDRAGSGHWRKRRDVQRGLWHTCCGRFLMPTPIAWLRSHMNYAARDNVFGTMCIRDYLHVEGEQSRV